MNLFNIFLSLILSITLCSCYTSEVPISNSKNSQIDTEVLGEWGTFDKEGKLDLVIKISALDNYNYVVSGTNFKDVSLSNFIAHSSTINNQKYINLRELDSNKEESYIFFKYELKNDSLLTYGLDGNQFIKKFKSSKQFKRYIKKNSKVFNEKFKEAYHFIKINSSPK